MSGRPARTALAHHPEANSARGVTIDKRGIREAAHKSVYKPHAEGPFPVRERASGLGSLNDSGVGRGWLLIVLCRVFGGCIWFACPGRMADGPVCPGGTGSDCAGVASFPGCRGQVAGQAGAGRVHSRCQQARNASFQGQVRLIFSTRCRAVYKSVYKIRSLTCWVRALLNGS